MIIEYKSISVYFTDEGEGKVIVLLHGFLSSSTMWNSLVPELRKKNRIISIDLLGHGHTECLGYIHSMELMADAVSAVLSHLKIIQLSIIGHSLGGYVALAFAEKHPKKIKGICLMNSTAEEDSPERVKLRNRAIKVSKTNYVDLVKVSIRNLFRPKNLSIYSEEIKALKKEALKTPLQGYIAAQEGMKIRKNREIILQSRNFKKMMIISRKDPVLEYHTLIKQAKKAKIEIVEFPDGHMPYIENRSNFLQAIMHFIENI